MDTESTDYLDEVVAERARMEPEIAGKWSATKIVLQLRKTREARGITQTQIADTLGLSQPHVARLERTPWTASFARILAYAEALGVELTPLTVEVTETRSAS